MKHRTRPWEGILRRTGLPGATAVGRGEPLVGRGEPLVGRVRPLALAACRRRLEARARPRARGAPSYPCLRGYRFPSTACPRGCRFPSTACLCVSSACHRVSESPSTACRLECVPPWHSGTRTSRRRGQGSPPRASAPRSSPVPICDDVRCARPSRPFPARLDAGSIATEQRSAYSFGRGTRAQTCRLPPACVSVAVGPLGPFRDVIAYAGPVMRSLGQILRDSARNAGDRSAARPRRETWRDAGAIAYDTLRGTSNPADVEIAIPRAIKLNSRTLIPSMIDSLRTTRETLNHEIPASHQHGATDAGPGHGGCRAPYAGDGADGRRRRLRDSRGRPSITRWR